MTCQHPGCSFDIFSSCINHCMQNLCLIHLIDHGDIFLHDFTDLLDHLDKSTCILMQETNFAETQNPQEADPLMRLQKDLDDTKDILKKTLVDVLERGEHLDDLVDRSNHLSIEAKAIYKTARKTNRCCTLF
ncbi:unnamed protein product [Rotaria sp. Silwood1]|nr:unnamed protein product [Rotaria sp. Silwood1]